MSTALNTFVEKAIERGLPRAEIARVLAEAGWSAQQIDKALGAWAEAEGTSVPLAVPRPEASLSAREAFLYLLLFTTLAISAFNVGSILFLAIDGLFPDPADMAPWEWRERRLRWNLSSVLVAFPVFAAVAFLVQRTLVQDPTKRASGIRRWLTYLSLFITAAILIGDLIGLLNAVLAGELTVRFVLKSLTIAVLAGGIFGYLLWDLRQDERAGARESASTSLRAVHRAWLICATAVVAATVVAALLFSAPPGWDCFELQVDAEE